MVPPEDRVMFRMKIGMAGTVLIVTLSPHCIIRFVGMSFVCCPATGVDGCRVITSIFLSTKAPFTVRSYIG